MMAGFENEMLLTMIYGFLPLVIGLILAFYIYNAIALMTIAKKTNTPNAWMAWLPVFDFYLVTQVGKLSGYWTLSYLTIFIPIIGSLFFLGAYIYAWVHMCTARNKPGWLAIFLIIPFETLDSSSLNLLTE